MKLSTVVKFRKELECVKKLGLTIAEYCQQNKKNRSWFTERIKKVLDTKDLYIEEAAQILELYSELIDNRGRGKGKEFYKNLADSLLNGKPEKIISKEENDKEDKTHVTYIRNTSTNNIESYDVIVYIKDSKPFRTVLSREDTETLFGLYTYYGGNITARNVTNEFPKYTLPEVKRLFRAFKLTKDSAWFPPHLGEELTEEELSQYRMNLKERAAFKYADARQEKDFKNTLNKYASEINKLKDFRSYIESIYKENCDIEKVKSFPKLKQCSNHTMVIYLSDMHIGARVDDKALFNNTYNMDVVYNRLDQILEYLQMIHPLKKIIVAQLGDLIDGMDGMTARKDHTIPQNMNNFEQVNNAVAAIKYLFDNMIQNGCAQEYTYISVPCGNHGGALEYATTKLIEATLNTVYPGIETVVEDKFFVRYDVNNYTLLCAHGKDEAYMRNGFKINLDNDTELKINQYIDSLSNVKENVCVISGDLHNESMNRGKRFKYYKVGSFFGSSEYCMYGWGNTLPHINYHIISDNILMNGTIELK